MSKQISDEDLQDLKYAFSNLGKSLTQFESGNYIDAIETFKFTQGLLDRFDLRVVGGVKPALEPAQKENKKPGLQPPAPEPPKDGGSLGHIPASILKDIPRSEILSHVMERVDRQ